MIRVALVDDHRILVESLCRALEAEDVVVVAIATTLEAGRVVLDEHAPDVAIIDIRLSDGSGLELVRSAPATRCLILSMSGGAAFVESAFRVGARGYFLKSCASSLLRWGIREVAAGRSAYDPDVLLHGSPARWRTLSGRDRDLVRLVLESRSNDEIARTLGIARKTVEAHLGRLFDRFSVLTRTELALKAEREGWLEIPSD